MRTAEGNSLISRAQVVRLFVIAVIPTTAKLAFDFTVAAAYVYPQFEFGQNSIAFVTFLAAAPCVLIIALVRLFQKRIVECAVLLIACVVPFSFDGTINREFWKFRIHRSEYQSIVEADPRPPPKYRFFNWGNRNTQLMGGGVIFEGIVYDEAGEIALPLEGRSPEWTERRLNPLPEDRWITSPDSKCKRRTESFGDNFYFVSEEC